MRRQCWWFVVVACALWGALAQGYGALPPVDTKISGRWQLNATASDDAEAILAKRVNEELQRERRLLQRQYPSSGPERDAARFEDSVYSRKLDPRRDEEFRRLLGMTKVVEVRQGQGATVEILSDLESRRFEAGRRSQVSMPGGQLADSAVGWDKEWFIIERRVRNGPRVTEKFRWLKKTDQLESLTTVGGDTPIAGLKVRRIFDRVAGAPPPTDPALGPVR